MPPKKYDTKKDEEKLKGTQKDGWGPIKVTSENESYRLILFDFRGKPKKIYI